MNEQTVVKKTEIKENPPQEINREEDPKMFTYQDILNRDKNPVWARKQIFNYTQTHSIAETAKAYGCHINTIKHIKRRGKGGEFSNRSKAPKTQKRQISEALIQLIYTSREDKGMGPLNLKHQYDIPVSASTIYRYLKKKPGVMKPRRKKWRQSKDLRAIKQKYKAFEHVQVDGKVLYDIPAFYPYYISCHVPTLQFTFTCQKTGASFISYADGETMMAGCTFIVYVFEHLKRYGINVKKIRLKTDSGSYAIGSVRSFKKSAFTQLIQTTYGAKHRFIKHKNQNADVERFHGLIEEYFYKRTQPNNQADFFKKAFEYSIWHNTLRKNGSKSWKTPLQILKEDYPNIQPEVLQLPPIYLNKYSDLYFYKVDPNYKPLSKEDFFRDSDPAFFTWLTSSSFQDDCLYFWGDASKSCFINKPSKGAVYL